MTGLTMSSISSLCSVKSPYVITQLSNYVKRNVCLQPLWDAAFRNRNSPLIPGFWSCSRIVYSVGYGLSWQQLIYKVSENLHLITSLAVSLFRIFRNISLSVSVGFFLNSSRIFTLNSNLKKIFSKLLFFPHHQSCTSMAKTSNKFISVRAT